jgi:hypothetical protein
MKIKHLGFDTQSPRFRVRRPLAFATALASVALATLASISANAASPYVGASFTSLSLALPPPMLPHSFGQGPSWTAVNSNVLSMQLDNAGINQIYSSPLSQSPETCLTCTRVQGPNGLPQERPGTAHDWILFESYGQQPTHLGNPGFGGYGGDLYVMHPDGSNAYRLTTTSDPNLGIPYGAAFGTPYDNFHAYWSPDGNHIVWTHLEADSLLAGGQKWEILLGDFKVIGGVPQLKNVTVVGPPYGAYETEPWSPDGNGFIFFATGGRQSPFQATTTPPGWGNSRIYYMRVYGTGASPSNPMVTPLTDNLPFYAEQAVFTPDMQAVIMMSNRQDAPTTWTREVMSGAQNSGFDDLNTGATQTVQFLADFEGPDFTSDLYLVDENSASKSIQRLTFFNDPPGATRYIVPEFYWNSSYTELLWTLETPIQANTVTYVGFFSVNTPVATTTPGWITAHEQAIHIGNVGAQAQVPTQLGPVDNAPMQVQAPVNPAAPLPHAASGTDNQTAPNVATTYITPWQTDLTVLGTETFQNLALPGLARLVGL